MNNIWLPVKLVAALALLIAIVGMPAVSAQQNSQLRGTWFLSPPQTTYTATDDLWTWRSNKHRTSVRSERISSMLTYEGPIDEQRIDDIWAREDQLLMEYAMDLDLRYVPDMDSDSSGMVVSGRANGRVRTPDLGWFLPEIDDEVIVGAVSWNAKVTGDGTCVGEECDIEYEMSGPLRSADGGRKCGEMSVVARSVVNSADQVWEFKSIAGMDSEADDLAFWSASLTIDVAPDGSTCFIGETEKNHLTGEVAFSYSEVALGGPDTTTRVMPGDNVQIIDRYDRRGIEVNLLSSQEGRGDILWDPATNPLTMLQSMGVEVRYDSGRNVAGLSGSVRGVFPSGLVAEGWVTGQGACVEDGNDGIACEIQMIRTFDILEERSGGRCGSMSLSVTADYVPGESWTFRENGAGVISLRDNPNCSLVESGRIVQPDTR
jgi:hypothetical protein